jgi:putative transposase
VVDHEGEVLESFVTNTRDKKAALKFLKKTLKQHGGSKEMVTDRRRSYCCAFKDLGSRDGQETGRWANNRTESSRQPFRRRAQAILRFRRTRTSREFAAVNASAHTTLTRSTASSHASSSSMRAPSLSPSGAISLRPNGLLLLENWNWRVSV